MKCPRCQHDNRRGARFCEECATPLARTCSNCGTALSATAKFCHACAHPVAAVMGAPSRSPDSYTPKHLAEMILTSKAALEGERKHVTVLFADLKGSMELLADRGPEEARKILDPVLERHAPRGIVGHRAWDCHALGRACLLLGRLDEAGRLGDRALESSPLQPGFAAHALHLLGDIASHADRFDAERAMSHYHRALALAEPRGMRPLVAHCHLGLGKLYRRTDKREQARERLAAATTMYREMGMTYWLEEAEAEMRESV
jgi:tetratricopeptide (TPR) repeat protein